MTRLHRLAGLACALLATPAGAAFAEAGATPAAVLAAAPAADWTGLDPANLLVLDLARGGRVVILLADGLAPAHAANIRALARAHWYDDLVVERVQDDYVVQWGDPDNARPLPAGLPRNLPAEYERSAAGLAVTPLPYRDTYAAATGFAGAFPVGEEGGRAWLIHCYGMVGVGRDLNPDTGTGAELYAVIGQPTRPLDRNIAVVGRVVQGMDVLSALPRGTADLGFYADPSQRLSIRQVRMASELPAAERPRLEVLDPASTSFHAWVQVRANRQDSFFLRPAGAIDVCNALPPVRPVAH